MTMVVAGLVFVLLLAVAIAHFIWSLGGSWPIRDKALLARTVIGRPGVSRVPRVTTTCSRSMSSPRRRTLAPGSSGSRHRTRRPSSSSSQCSCITTVSAPSGSGAPVKMRAQVPGVSGPGASPAATRWLTARPWGCAAASAARKA